MRGFKGVLISVMVFGSAGARAGADFSYQSLHIEKDGAFELRVNTPKGPAVFKDRDLQANGQTVSKKAGAISVDLVRYPDHPLVTAFVTAPGILNGAVFVLKGDEKGDYAALNDKPIMGKSVDFADVLEGLTRTKGNDSSLVLEALVNHFAANPKEDLFAYANSLENGVDTAMRESQRESAPPEAKGRMSAPPAGAEDESSGNEGPSTTNDEPIEEQAADEPPPESRRERVKIRRPIRDPYQRQGYPQGGYYGGDPRQPQPWGW